MHIIDKGLFSSNIKSFYKFKETDQININQNKEKEERESKGTSSSEKKNSFLKIWKDDDLTHNKKRHPL